ncbi:protein FAM81B isoform X5 [Caretta caretta]|uniref:protein FAM81B isoform X5 n=1 Tax=Caretta caretta TaxID=8467 RepID=UPI003F4B79B0
MSENSTELVNYPDKSQAFLPAIPMIPGNRVNLLENRVSSQERTTAVLLDQAFRIKDDIVSYLQGSKGHQQGEATARQLLENHIQTITSIVKKLSHDIEVLEKQIRTRDNVATGTTFAVQSLDHKYLHGFGDLRGRVARCDASIAKLSGDINIIRHEIQRLEKEIGGIRSTSESYANNLEMKVMRLLDKIETSNSEQSSHLKTVQGDQHHELQLLDFKTPATFSAQVGHKGAELRLHKNMQLILLMSGIGGNGRRKTLERETLPRSSLEQNLWHCFGTSVLPGGKQIHLGSSPPLEDHASYLQVEHPLGERRSPCLGPCLDLLARSWPPESDMLLDQWFLTWGARCPFWGCETCQIFLEGKSPRKHKLTTGTLSTTTLFHQTYVLIN